MAQRDLERDFAKKVRETVSSMRELELSTLLRVAEDYGLAPGNARARIDWIRQSEARQLNTPTTERPTRRAVGWEDFEAQAKRDEESPWALKPYFPMALLSIVAGEQKSGKTLWVSWAVGEMLRAGKRVLFVQLDTARTVLRQRLLPFLPEDKSGLAILFRDKDEVATEAGVERLLTEARAHQADVIVIDSLFRAMPGMDENDTNDIRKVTTNLERLGTESGAAIVVLHHVRKAGSDGRDDIVSADVRGGGGLLSSAAVVVLIQKRKAETEGEARFNVTCGDTWFEPFKPMRCCVTFGAAEPMSMTEAEEGISAADLRRGKVRIHLLRLLGDSRQWMTTREILAASRGLARNEMVLQCLDDLVAQLQLEWKDGPRRAKMYRVFPGAGKQSETPGNSHGASVSVFPTPLGGKHTGNTPDSVSEPEETDEDWKSPDDGNDT
jgi:hypothetical protein